MAYSYSVNILRRNLQSQFRSNGQGYRWLDRVRLAMHRAAVRGAPARSGELKAKHRSFIRGINQWACTAEIVNDAEHAEWVHDGTFSPIVPTSRPNLVLRAGGGYGTIRKRAVAGQKSNPWLDRACSSVAIRNGGVPIG